MPDNDSYEEKDKERERDRRRKTDRTREKDSSQRPHAAVMVFPGRKSPGSVFFPLSTAVFLYQVIAAELR